jgi:hypothetical protein
VNCSMFRATGSNEWNGSSPKMETWITSKQHILNSRGNVLSGGLPATIHEPPDMFLNRIGSFLFWEMMENGTKNNMLELRFGWFWEVHEIYAQVANQFLNETRSAYLINRQRFDKSIKSVAVKVLYRLRHFITLCNILIDKI